MFSFEYKMVENLPKLAWLAVINKKSQTVVVWHGKSVEHTENFFVAGVWDGKFEDADFDKSSVFWGTGAKIDDEGVRFITPSHALERLVLTEDEHSIVVSNSFPFILSYNEFHLDNKIDQYESIMCSMLDGPKKMQENIPMQEGKVVKQYIVSIISITNYMDVSIRSRSAIEEFTSFSDYYGRMQTAMALIRDNSVSEKRETTRYGLVSTISSGYDSSTCAAIAKEIGCDTVVTLLNGKYVNDSGEEIAKQLGYNKIIKRDYELYKDKQGNIDAEYVSSGEAGTQLQFSVFEDVFEDNIAIFGVRGSYWDKESKITDDFEMGEHFNCEADVSWTENALKNGYIAAPIPTYGASTCSSIRKVTNTEEMKPWTLGTKYDKPIPRRILEEKGVSRESFGMKKYGGGFCFSYETKRSLKGKMSKEGYASFLKFQKETGHERRSFSRMLHRIKYFSLFYPLYWNAVAGKLGIKFRLKQKVFRMSNPGVPSDMIFWGVNEMKQRYAVALADIQKS